MSLQELVYEEKREQFANFKDFQNVIRDKWHDVDIRQPESEKPRSSGKMTFISNGKAKWSTHSAHFLLNS